MKSLRIFIVLTGSLLALLSPKRFASACGFYVFPGEYRFWLLQPDLVNQPDLTPFFFASTYFYKGDINLAVENYVDQNITEWYQEIKQKTSRNDIDSLLNQTDPQYFFDHEKEIALHNGFLTFLSRPENKELYRYLRLSKKVEQVAVNPNPWGEGIISSATIDIVIAEAVSLYKTAVSSFVKLRAAYQLVRLYRYAGLDDKLNHVYDAGIAPVKTKSWIKTAALYQKAIYTEGYEGQYLLSKVFDEGGYNRSHCLERMRSGDKNRDSTLLYAKNLHERTVIEAMMMFNYAGRSLSGIRKIYNSEPAYKDLAFLLLREINKIEDWLVTIKVTEFGSPAVYNGDCWSRYEYMDAPTQNYKSDKVYAKAVYDFLLQVIADKKQKNISLLRLYASHLALLDNNLTASAQHLSEIDNELQLPQNVRTQVQINRFLLHLENGFDKPVEDEFMQIMKKSPKQLGVYDADIMKDQLILYTSRKLVARGLKTKGLMLMGQTHRALGDLPIDAYKNVYQELEEIATPAIYDDILNTLAKKNKTAFEHFVSKDPTSYPAYYGNDIALRWNKSKLLDGKASWYIRNHNLDAALAVFQQIPDSLWKEEPYSYFINGNPFFLNIYHAYETTIADKRKLNKREVIEQMVHLEKLAKQDPGRAAECYFQLANAWYNMSWWGKNWLIVKQWWSRDEMHDNPGFRRSDFNDDYYGCNKAKEYYLMAMQQTKDKNLASLCCFMAGICQNNFQRYTGAVDTGNDWYDYDKTPGLYVNRLKQKGINTKVYNELVSECALYLDFIGKYNKQL